MVTTFRYYLNKQGKISKMLNENSYHVYIIHVIVIGCIALIMLNLTIPSLLKYLTLAVSTWVISNLIVYFYRSLIKKKHKQINDSCNILVLLNLWKICGNYFISKVQLLGDKIWSLIKNAPTHLNLLSICFGPIFRCGEGAFCAIFSPFNELAADRFVCQLDSVFLWFYVKKMPAILAVKILALL